MITWHARNTVRLAPLFCALRGVFCPSILPSAPIGCSPLPSGDLLWRARQRLGRRSRQACLVPCRARVVCPGGSPGVTDTQDSGMTTDQVHRTDHATFSFTIVLGGCSSAYRGMQLSIRASSMHAQVYLPCPAKYVLQFCWSLSVHIFSSEMMWYFNQIVARGLVRLTRCGMRAPVSAQVHG